MNRYNNCATIIVSVLFLFVTCSDSADLLNSAKDAVVSPMSNVAKKVVPKCLFGVDKVSYILYTRDHRQGVRVQMQDEKIPLRHGKPFAFVIHGFVSQVNKSTFYDLTNNWIEKEDINIFSVDWDDAACYGSLPMTDAITYGSAVKNVPVVGESVAKFTMRLAQSFGVKINEIVIVGHSLGAHVSGHAGKAIQRLTNQKLKRIVGLDPAGPLFHGKGCADRLCVTDATDVQALHTSVVYGIHEAIGAANFYFHGGLAQPECSGTDLPSCDHERVVTYAAISVMRPHCFLGTRWQLDSRNILSTRQCNTSSCAYAGVGAPQENVRGTFYVALTSKAPYCSE